MQNQSRPEPSIAQSSVTRSTGVQEVSANKTPLFGQTRPANVKVYIGNFLIGTYSERSYASVVKEYRPPQVPKSHFKPYVVKPFTTKRRPRRQKPVSPVPVLVPRQPVPKAKPVLLKTVPFGDSYVPSLTPSPIYSKVSDRVKDGVAYSRSGKIKKFANLPAPKRIHDDPLSVVLTSQMDLRVFTRFVNHLKAGSLGKDEVRQVRFLSQSNMPCHAIADQAITNCARLLKWGLASKMVGVCPLTLVSPQKFHEMRARRFTSSGRYDQSTQVRLSRSQLSVPQDETSVFRQAPPAACQRFGAWIKGKWISFAKTVGSFATRQVFNILLEKVSLEIHWEKFVAWIKEKANALYSLIEPYFKYLKSIFIAGVAGFLVVLCLILRRMAPGITWKDYIIAAFIAVGIPLASTLMSALWSTIEVATCTTANDALWSAAHEIVQAYNEGGVRSAFDAARQLDPNHPLARYFLNSHMPCYLSLVWNYLGLEVPAEFHNFKSSLPRYLYEFCTHSHSSGRDLILTGFQIMDNSSTMDVKPAIAHGYMGDAHPGFIYTFYSYKRDAIVTSPNPVVIVKHVLAEFSGIDHISDTCAQLCWKETPKPTSQVHIRAWVKDNYEKCLALEDPPFTSPKRGGPTFEEVEDPIIPSVSTQSGESKPAPAPVESEPQGLKGLFGRIVAKLYSSIGDSFGEKVPIDWKVVGAGVLTWQAIRNANTLLVLIEKVTNLVSMLAKAVYRRYTGHDFDKRDALPFVRLFDAWNDKFRAIQQKTLLASWTADRKLCKEIVDVFKDSLSLAGQSTSSLLFPATRAEFIRNRSACQTLAAQATNALVQPSVRKVPVAVFFVGPPGCGKTTSMQAIGQTLGYKTYGKEAWESSGGVYSKGLTKFWDAFSGQRIISFDEIGAAKDPKEDIATQREILTILSSMPSIPDMAAVDQKGSIAVDPDYVLMASMNVVENTQGNGYNLTAISAALSQPEALWRRVVIIEVTRSKGKYDNSVFEPKSYDYWLHDFTAAGGRIVTERKFTHPIEFGALCSMLYSYHKERTDPSLNLARFEQLANDVKDDTNLAVFKDVTTTELAQIGKRVFDSDANLAKHALDVLDDFLDKDIVGSPPDEDSDSEEIPLDRKGKAKSQGLMQAFQAPVTYFEETLEPGWWSISSSEKGWVPIKYGVSTRVHVSLHSSSSEADYYAFHTPWFLSVLNTNYGRLSVAIGMFAALAYLVGRSWMSKSISKDTRAYILLIPGVDTEKLASGEYAIRQAYDHGVIQPDKGRVVPYKNLPGYVPTQFEPKVPAVPINVQAPSDVQAIHKIFANMRSVWHCNKQCGSLLMLRDNVAFVNQHVYDLVKDYSFSIRWESKSIVNERFYDGSLRPSYTSVGRDVYLLVFPPRDLRGARDDNCPDITAHITRDDNDSCPTYTQMIVIKDTKLVTHHIRNVAMGASNVDGMHQANLYRGTNSEATYEGMCGSVWYSNEGASKGVYALHYAGFASHAVGVPLGIHRQAVTFEPSEERWHLPQKSNIRPTPLNSTIYGATGDYPCKKAPAHLVSWKDGDKIRSPLGEALDSWVYPPEKSKRFLKSDGTQDLEFTQFYMDILKAWVWKPWDEFVSTENAGNVFLTQHEAFNGFTRDGEVLMEAVDLSKSAGYPGALHPNKKKKVDYTAGPPTNRTFTPELWEQMKRFKADPKSMKYLGFLKDELRKPGKSTRMVYGEPYVRTLFLRRAIGSLLIALRKKRPFPCAVGINPTSKEWADLYSKLKEATKTFDLDATKMDTTCGVEGEVAYKTLFEYFIIKFRSLKATVAPMVWEFEGETITFTWDEVVNIVQEREIRVLIEAWIFTITHNPSGTTLTAINNMFALIYIHSHWYWTSYEGEKSLAHFLAWLLLVTYGDDVIAMCFGEGPNVDSLSDDARSQGFFVTNAAKTGRVCETPVENLTFLKRSFVPFTKDGVTTILAPLDLESIGEMPLWYNATQSWQSQAQSHFDAYVSLMSHHPTICTESVLKLKESYARRDIVVQIRVPDKFGPGYQVHRDAFEAIEMRTQSVLPTSSARRELMLNALPNPIQQIPQVPFPQVLNPQPLAPMQWPQPRVVSQIFSYMAYLLLQMYLHPSQMMFLILSVFRSVLAIPIASVISLQLSLESTLYFPSPSHCLRHLVRCWVEFLFLVASMPFLILSQSSETLLSIVLVSKFVLPLMELFKRLGKLKQRTSRMWTLLMLWMLIIMIFPGWTLISWTCKDRMMLSSPYLGALIRLLVCFLGLQTTLRLESYIFSLSTLSYQDLLIPLPLFKLLFTLSLIILSTTETYLMHLLPCYLNSETLTLAIASH